MNSKQITVKWSNELEEHMIKFHNIKIEEMVDDVLNIAKEEDWKELMNNG